MKLALFALSMDHLRAEESTRCWQLKIPCGSGQLHMRP